MLIFGLGNPGIQYQKTRHNIGRDILKSLAKDFLFPPFKDDKRNNFSITQKKIFNKKVTLGVSLVYMNESGKAVKALFSYLDLKTEDLWLVHDDLDLPVGKIKISKNRSAAGHKGVQSVIDYLGTKNFYRFRIGIKSNSKVDVAKFVLKKFIPKEVRDKIIQLGKEALIFAIENSPTRAMQKFNYHARKETITN